MRTSMPLSIATRKRAPSVALLAILGIVGPGVMQVASADVLQLSYDVTASGTTGTGVNTVLAVPGSHTYGNTLPALSTPVYTIPTGPSAGQSFEFYDAYVFTITGASSNSLTSSINLGEFLGLNDFQVRLYELAGNNPSPVFGSPAGGTLLESWSQVINYGPNMNGTIAVIPEHTLSAGSYVLEVRGNVSGSSGGSYSGVINLTPVPLPAAVWLLVSGIGGFGALSRRRRQYAQ